MASIRLQTNRLKKGMIIKADVYTYSGVVIVPAETPVTRDVVSLLNRHFVDEVLVEYTVNQNNSSSENREFELPKLLEYKVKEFKQEFKVAEESLSDNLKEVLEQDKEVDIQALLDIVQNVVNKADNEMELCTMLCIMKNYSESLYAHSLNVALYGKMLADWIGLEKEERELVLLAGLLHDIGHLAYQNEGRKFFLLHEDIEKKCNEKHPLTGYKLLKDKDLDYRICQAVLTHHERMDGSGFPMKVLYENINKISRILSIVDTYVTMLTEEPGYMALSPFDALNTFQVRDHGKFDSGYLLIFIEHIARNFIRQKVRLNNGKTGTIVMLNKFDLLRPLVQVDDCFIDLSVHNDLQIKEIIV